VSRIAVVGTGYVGLPTAACLASLGHRVVGADIDRVTVGNLNAGIPHLHEAGLEPMLRHGIEAGRLSFVAGASAAVRDAEFVFLCLPTPAGPDGAADTRAVLAASEEIGPWLAPGTVVVDKSTVPVGTSRVVAERIGRNDIHVVANPEFLREGMAVHDFLHPERVVVGADDPAVADAVCRLYCGVGAPTVVVSPEAAELAKYVANAFLATRLSLVNEVAGLCEVLGADMDEVVAVIATDSRIGSQFLQPGPGWGGSCLPKDVTALRHMAQQHHYEVGVLSEVQAANQRQHGRIADCVARAAGGSLEGLAVGMWGVTFKAETDDLRNSPALEVARRLCERGAVVQAYDPTLSDRKVAASLGLVMCTNPYEACRSASVLLIATEWPEFCRADLHRAGAVMMRRVIVDSRNLLDPSSTRRAGFSLVRMGRATPTSTDPATAESAAVADGEEAA
jgi:UDPglucose 6-dehydrogenase